MKLSLYYPVRPVFINQKFGEIANLQYYKDNGIDFKGHNGIDFMANHGQPVYATHDGICFPEIDIKGGNGVVIMSIDQFDYNGGQAYFKTISWHFIQDDAVVKTGQQVKAGDLIGYADSTGLSTGDHLHFGLKPVQKGEPLGTWYTMNPDNGYMGAIDPQPYFNGLNAADINPSNDTFKVDFGYGDMSSDVLKLQQFLVYRSFASFIPTGFFGSKTEAAVRFFQSQYGIPKTGFMGPLTRAKINSFIG